MIPDLQFYNLVWPAILHGKDDFFTANRHPISVLLFFLVCFVGSPLLLALGSFVLANVFPGVLMLSDVTTFKIKIYIPLDYQGTLSII